MKNNIRIESDGTARGTRVLSAAGEELKGITRIVIDPLEVGGIVVATITFTFVELDLDAA